MALLQLPAELINLICEAVFDDDDELEARVERNCSPSILNLALTCRLLCDIATPWLLREIRLPHPSPCADALLVRLRTNPSDGRRIQSLFLWNKEDVYTGDHSELDFLLKSTINLHELYAPFFPPRALSSTLLDKKLQCARTIERLCLDGSNCYDIDALFQLLSFPRLQSFQMFCFTDNICRSIQELGLSGQLGLSTQLRLYSQLPRLPLTCLRLTSCQIGMPLFDAIISQCSYLQQLEFLLPFPAEAYRIQDSWDTTWASARVFIPDSISMAPIAVRLNRFKETLTELHFLTNRQFWQDHDGTKLDLSEFSSLKFLWASSNCFFHCHSAEIARQGFYRLLPFSLCYLDVIWGQDSGIFFPNHDVPPGTIRAWHDRELRGDNDHTWIVELARQKKGHLPHLQEVQFHEDMKKLLGGGVHDLEDWSPRAVMEEYAQAGVSLTVMYRSMQ